MAHIIDPLPGETIPSLNAAARQASDLLNPFNFRVGDFNLAQSGRYYDSFLNSQFMDILKTVSIIATLAMVLMMLYIITQMRKMNQKPVTAKPTLLDELAPPEPAQGGAFTARWGEIRRHMDSTKEVEWKFAIIEADKLIDIVFQKAGFPGATLGERMMNLKDGEIQNMQDLWDAHKIRNRLAHDLNYFLRYTEAKQAILSYEKVLQELGAI
jgi:hypothetical protein